MKKIFFVLRCAVILLLGFAFIAVAAEKTSDRRYTLPDHGVLQMKVPATWKDEVKQQSDNLPPIITLKPASGGPSIISITPFGRRAKMRLN